MRKHNCLVKRDNSIREIMEENGEHRDEKMNQNLGEMNKNYENAEISRKRSDSDDSTVTRFSDFATRSGGICI